jgi:hypothetical protein
MELTNFPEFNRHRRLSQWGPVVCAGIFVGIVYYLIFLYPNAGFPITIDFTSWLSAGRMVAEGQGTNIYDLPMQLVYQKIYLGSYYTPGGILVYNRFPFFVLPLIPLSQLPFILAYAIWMIANILAGGLAIWLIVKHILPDILPGNSKVGTVWAKWVIISLGFFPVVWGLYEGQTSLIELLILTTFYFLLKNKHQTLAGIVLALGSFKPQMILAFGLLLLLRKSWRSLFGFSITIAVLGGISIGLVGLKGFQDYFSITNQVYNWNCIYGVYPDNQQSWRGLLVGWLTPNCGSTMAASSNGLLQANLISNVLNVLTFMILSIGLWLGRKADAGSPAFDLLFVLAGITSLLASPYSNPQELTRLILIAALLWRISLTSPGWLPKYLDLQILEAVVIGLSFFVTAPVTREVKPFFFLMLGVYILLFYHFFQKNRNSNTETI